MMSFHTATTVAFTGSRALTPPQEGDFFDFKETLNCELFKLLGACYKQGKRVFMSGMAVGWDLLAAEQVLNLKQIYPDVELIAVVPFRGQETRYSRFDQYRYGSVLSKATRVIVISEGGFSIDAYHQRNDFLVNSASLLIAYHKGDALSGTASTVAKAHKRGVEVCNVYDMLRGRKER